VNEDTNQPIMETPSVETPESVKSIPEKENRKLFLVFGTTFVFLTLAIFGVFYYYQNYYLQTDSGETDELQELQNLMDQVDESMYDDSLLDVDDADESTYSQMNNDTLINEEINAIDKMDFTTYENEYTDTKLNDLN